MSWLFGQTWIWYLIAFVVGVLLAWLLFVLPAQRRLRKLEAGGGTRPATEQTTALDRDKVGTAAAGAAAVGGAGAAAAAGAGSDDDATRVDAPGAADVDDAPTEQIPAVDPALSMLDKGRSGLPVAPERTTRFPIAGSADPTTEIPVVPPEGDAPTSVFPAAGAAAAGAAGLAAAGIAGAGENSAHSAPDTAALEPDEPAADEELEPDEPAVEDELEPDEPAVEEPADDAVDADADATAVTAADSNGHAGAGAAAAAVGAVGLGAAGVAATRSSDEEGTGAPAGAEADAAPEPDPSAESPTAALQAAGEDDATSAIPVVDGGAPTKETPADDTSTEALPTVDDTRTEAMPTAEHSTVEADADATAADTTAAEATAGTAAGAEAPAADTDDAGSAPGGGAAAGAAGLGIAGLAAARQHTDDTAADETDAGGRHTLRDTGESVQPTEVLPVHAEGEPPADATTEIDAADEDATVATAASSADGTSAEETAGTVDEATTTTDVPAGGVDPATTVAAAAAGVAGASALGIAGLAAAGAGPASDAPADAAAEEPPFGPGSARSNADGSAPGPEYTIKGNADSMLYHSPESPYYVRTRAEAWFSSTESAEAAGFSPWFRRRSGNAAATGKDGATEEGTSE